MDRDTGVAVNGLRDLRRDLKRVAPEADKELTRELRGIAQDVAAEARSSAVKRTNTYARSIRAYTEAGGSVVGSRLPQAGVLHWGGTIRPRGVPIVFPRRAVVYEAADRMEEQIFDRAGAAIERAARQAGWT